MTLTNREGSGQESKPLILNRSHQETVCSKSGETFKVKRRRAGPRERGLRTLFLLADLVDLNGEEILFVRDFRNLTRTRLNSGQGLCDRVGNATQYLARRVVSNAAPYSSENIP